jgi:NAD(P)-dependent dehydrogenase (short-subunit alcohol dehydrogenase family)
MGRKTIEVLVQGLKQIGIPYAFGVPGRAVMPIYNAFFDSGFPECVLATHETAAAFMACSWATLTGVPGVVLGTTGPGATNMATGLATAFTEGIPLVAITGEVPLHEVGRRTYQESSGFGRSVDTVATLAPVTKRSGKAFSAPHLSELLATWVPIARTGRPGPVHISVPWDLWDHEISEKLFEDCLRSMTQAPTPTPPATTLDGLIHCAGDGMPSAFEATASDEFRRLFELHVLAPFELAQALLPGMRCIGGGRIIAVSSLAAIRPRRFMGAYASTKAALRTMIQCLADEVAGHNITANIISPGGVDTELGRRGRAALDELEGNTPGSEISGRVASLPLGRALTPEDLIDTFRLLIGPGGSAISGQDIIVAGTTVMR